MSSFCCDYIVIGSGIAGLRAAIELAQHGTVKILCKTEPWQSNTQFAQGGIAAAMQEGDTVEFHLQDTLNAGDGLCYEPAVRVLVEEGPQRIEELVKYGARFDQVKGRFIFGREGAHTQNRILHAGDATGQEIVRALLNAIKENPQIEVLAHHPAMDFIVRDGRCVGVEILDLENNRRRAAFSRAILLATGGAGQIYSQSTNPDVATADGAAMAFRARAELMDLEFFQFHPTAFHYPGAPRFLITEALRGEGAVLKNVDGKLFMKQYHPMGDLAPRDIVSRAIVSEIRKTRGSWVYLDATSIPRKKLRDRFPTIYQFLEQYTLDLSIDLIPVSPSAHYWMGGVKTDLDGRTSLKGLFAAGEVACTGVHGANRLASNSLLEGLVFGARAGEAMLADNLAVPEDQSFVPPAAEQPTFDLAAAREELRIKNWLNLGLIRDREGIEDALRYHDQYPKLIASSVQQLELINLLDCSKLIGLFALKREESRGSHFRADFPEKNPNLTDHHTVLHNGNIDFVKLS